MVVGRDGGDVVVVVAGGVAIAVVVVSRLVLVVILVLQRTQANRPPSGCYRYPSAMHNIGAEDQHAYL